MSDPINATTPEELDALEAETSESGGQDPDVALACEAINRLLFIVAEAKNPRRICYSLLYALGNGAAVGGSASSIAKKFGVSKQAFEQEGNRYLESVIKNLRKSPLEKKPESSAVYKRANFRNIKKK